MVTENQTQKPEGSNPTENQPDKKGDESAPATPPASPKPKTPVATECQGNTYQEKKYRLAHKQFWVATLTLIALVMYTAIAAYQACKMQQATTAAQNSADAAKKAADTGAEALYSVQRSFIIYRRHDIGFRYAKAEQQHLIGWEFRPQWENVGTTPALHSETGFGIRFEKSSMPDDFTFQDTRPTITFSFGPKTVVTTTGDAVSIETVTFATRRKGHLYLYGWVAYNDVFHKTPRHITMFCSEVVGTTPGHLDLSRGVISGGTVNFVGCKHHNCADDDCIGEPYGRRGHKWPDAP